VKINLSMLGVLVLNGIGEEVDGADVVTVDQSGPRDGVVQLNNQLMNPARPCHAVSHGAVLCINAQTRDDVLAHRGPGDMVVTQKHRIARSRPASIGTTDPISASAHDEV
jgi:hypothetical protein